MNQREALASDKRLVLVGSTGSGKSAWLRQQIMKAILDNPDIKVLNKEGATFISIDEFVDFNALDIQLIKDAIERQEAEKYPMLVCKEEEPYRENERELMDWRDTPKRLSPKQKSILSRPTRQAPKTSQVVKSFRGR